VSESNGDGLSYDGCGLKKGGDITHRVKREGDRERECRKMQNVRMD